MSRIPEIPSYGRRYADFSDALPSILIDSGFASATLPIARAPPARNDGLSNRPFGRKFDSRGKEGSARLSPSKNRLVPPVQQFRRTLKGATALRTIRPRASHALLRILPPLSPAVPHELGDRSGVLLPAGQKKGRFAF